jgi:hypothetical protein
VAYGATDVTLTSTAADYTTLLSSGDANVLALAAALDSVTSPTSAPTGSLGRSFNPWIQSPLRPPLKPR